MDERYIRNLGALSAEECALLRSKKVFVAGCGGLGGYISEMLLRVGIGAVSVADGDVFELSNLNRQLLSDVEHIGTGKAAAAKARAEKVNPDVLFSAEASFVTADNAAALIKGCDAVIDALDNIPSRRILVQACRDAGIPYVYGAINGWVAQCAIIMPDDGLLSTLYPDSANLNSKSSLAFTPALCAAMQCALCVKLLSSRKVESGKLFYFDLLEFEFEKLF